MNWPSWATSRAPCPCACPSRPAAGCSGQFTAGSANSRTMPRTGIAICNAACRIICMKRFAKGWQHCIPKPGDDPRIMFTMSSNPFRRIRGSQKLNEVLLPKLKKYVVLDWRMSSSARLCRLCAAGSLVVREHHLQVGDAAVSLRDGDQSGDAAPGAVQGRL